VVHGGGCGKEEGRKGEVRKEGVEEKQAERVVQLQQQLQQREMLRGMLAELAALGKCASAVEEDVEGMTREAATAATEAATAATEAERLRGFIDTIAREGER
jgi:tRNA C32,U32 (ribose-2'-O)-methylase TrmJ